AADAVAVLDDMRLTRGARAVGGDDIAVVMNGMRRFRRELSRSPVRIAVPDAPRDRGIGLGQFLEDRDALHRRQVEPAICRRQENAEEPSTGQLAREIFRQPAGCLDRLTLRQDARPELPCRREKLDAVCRVPHLCLPRAFGCPRNFPFLYRRAYLESNRIFPAKAR